MVCLSGEIHAWAYFEDPLNFFCVKRQKKKEEKNVFLKDAKRSVLLGFHLMFPCHFKYSMKPNLPVLKYRMASNMRHAYFRRVFSRNCYFGRVTQNVS